MSVETVMVLIWMATMVFVLLTKTDNKTVKVWDLRDPTAGRLVREFRTHESHIFDVKFDVRRIVRWVLLLFSLPSLPSDKSPLSFSTPVDSLVLLSSLPFLPAPFSGLFQLRPLLSFPCPVSVR